MRAPVILLGMGAIAISIASHAENLGAIGPVYPIAEKHLLEHIAEQLKAKERNGELASLERDAQARAADSVLNPKAVAGLRRADAARTFYVDPTLTLDRNVVDATGRILFAAGTRKNPLDVVSLTKHLLFFDARDPRQLARARALLQVYQGRVKPILVGGSSLSLMRAWRTPIYFDQQGSLTRRLGISAVPAIVSQEGKRLRIDELVLP